MAGQARVPGGLRGGCSCTEEVRPEVRLGEGEGVCGGIDLLHCNISDKGWAFDARRYNKRCYKVQRTCYKSAGTGGEGEATVGVWPTVRSPSSAFRLSTSDMGM